MAIALGLHTLDSTACWRGGLMHPSAWVVYEDLRSEKLVKVGAWFAYFGLNR